MEGTLNQLQQQQLEMETIMGPEEEERERGQKELTENDIIEIFVRLPVKSLMRFNCVSKHWYNLIHSPNFIAMHSANNHHKHAVTLSLSSCSRSKRFTNNPITTVTFRFGDVTDTKKLSFVSLPKGGSVEMVGCFNGVVCLNLSRRPQKYALWNPATKQFRQIGHALMEGPDVSDVDVRDVGWYGSGFCFDQVTNASFKLVQVKLTSTQKGETRAQVNQFSTATNSWIGKSIVLPYRIRGSGFNIIRGATCVNGYMHWHVAIFHYDSELDDMYILSYNMIDEVFERIDMPFRPIHLHYHLTTYKGSLAVFVHRPNSDRSYTEVDVWARIDCGASNLSWSKILTCKPSVVVSRALGFFRKDGVDFILLYEDFHSFMYLYDPENGETKKFSMKIPISETFLYSESLASLDQRIGRIW